jgi:hypothetical protein
MFYLTANLIEIIATTAKRVLITDESEELISKVFS